MLRALTRLTLAALAAAVCAPTRAAQAAPAQPSPPAAQSPNVEADAWVTVSPEGENFTARMPRQPVSVEQRVRENGLDASGLRYAAEADDRTFIVWSMKGSYRSGRLGAGDGAGKFFPGVTPYLDAVAELALELLSRNRSRWQRLNLMEIGMSYTRELELSGRPAREYLVYLGKMERGGVYVSADATHVYVVAALGPDAIDTRLRRFLDSFSLKATETPRVGGGDAATGVGGGVGPGRGVNIGGASPAAGAGVFGGGGGGGGGVDYTRPFRQVEVTRKARITRKPEPGFTDQARKFSVTGTVRLRTILGADGEVKNIAVVRGLPHGLTERALAAARGIRFKPAEKDGRPVSQYAALEYHFNIY